MIWYIGLVTKLNLQKKKPFPGRQTQKRLFLLRKTIDSSERMICVDKKPFKNQKW